MKHIRIILTGCLLATFGSSGATPIDQIGPDPIRSENCVMITQERSFVCSGNHLPPSLPKVVPTITVNCGPGIFVLLTHEPVTHDDSVREITLVTDEGDFSGQWLAISESSSMKIIFNEPDGANSPSEFDWMLNLLGRMITRGLSRFGYSFVADEGASGVFDLDYSDRTLLESIVLNCR